MQDLSRNSTVVAQSDHKTPYRRIYYLSGYDPRGPSFYYRLFSEQINAYAARTGRSLTVGRRHGRADPLVSRWSVTEGAETVLEVIFLHWDDIVRNHWPRQPLVIAWQGCPFALWCLVRGGLFRFAHMFQGAALGMAYPFLFFGVCCVLLLLLWLLARAALIAISGFPFAVGIASLLVMALLPACWRLADQQGVVWLFRSFVFTHRLGQDNDAYLRSRVIEFAERIVAIERNIPAQSLHIVGHSCGSFVMVMTAAELRRHPAFDRELASRVRLLSLGQNLPHLGVHKGAAAFHDDLRSLAAVPRLPWRDISSRDDYLCFAGVDPYRTCGISVELPTYPQLELINLTPRLQLESWWELINNQFSLHFEYLHTPMPELHGGFDFFEELLGCGH